MKGVMEPSVLSLQSLCSSKIIPKFKVYLKAKQRNVSSENETEILCAVFTESVTPHNML